QVIERITGTGHIPVDHGGEVPRLDDPVICTRVVVADDLIRVQLGVAAAPPDGTGRPVISGDVVKVAQPRNRFFYHIVEHDFAVDGYAATLDIGEDFAVSVGALHMRDGAKSLTFKPSQEVMHRRRPRPGFAPHGASGALGAADITSG